MSGWCTLCPDMVSVLSTGTWKDLCKAMVGEEGCLLWPEKWLQMSGEAVHPGFSLAFVTVTLVHSLCISTVSTVAASTFSCEILLIVVSISKYGVYSPSVAFPTMCWSGQRTYLSKTQKMVWMSVWETKDFATCYFIHLSKSCSQ